jgi:hypothetical protein
LKQPQSFALEFASSYQFLPTMELQVQKPDIQNLVNIFLVTILKIYKSIICMS